METLLGYLPDWINKWGPLLLIILVMLYGLYRLVLKMINSATKVLTGVGKDVILALDKPTDALSKQANSMDRMTDSINEYVGRDQSEHQEIIILQKVIRRELMETRNDLTTMKAQSERIENRLKEIPDGRS